MEAATPVTAVRLMMMPVVGPAVPVRVASLPLVSLKVEPFKEMAPMVTEPEEASAVWMVYSKVCAAAVPVEAMVACRTMPLMVTASVASAAPLV